MCSSPLLTVDISSFILCVIVGLVVGIAIHKLYMSIRGCWMGAHCCESPRIYWPPFIDRWSTTTTTATTPPCQPPTIVLHPSDPNTAGFASRMSIGTCVDVEIEVQRTRTITYNQPQTAPDASDDRQQ